MKIAVVGLLTLLSVVPALAQGSGSTNSPVGYQQPAYQRQPGTQTTAAPALVGSLRGMVLRVSDGSYLEYRSDNVYVYTDRTLKQFGRWTQQGSDVVIVFDNGSTRRDTIEWQGQVPINLVNSRKQTYGLTQVR